MEHALDEVGPPPTAVFRIGWRGDPLRPPPWSKALADGTFGNRFDDPSASDGRPEESRFRCLYCGTTMEAAFGETLARKRVPIGVLAKLAAVDVDESVDAVLAGAAIDRTEPHRPQGLISAEWQSQRQIGRTTLDPALRFANVATRGSLQYLRFALAPVADRLGITDVDGSTMLNPGLRAFTQACARHIYELHEDGAPRFAGIRYVSRLDPIAWECWAIFFDRLRHTPGYPENVMADNPALKRVAHDFALTIEGPDGLLLRP